MPLQPRGKLPLTEHGSHDATADATIVAGWWDRWPLANIGIATGHNLFVIDLDGEQGIDAWRQLTDTHGDVQTLTSITGSGGRHLLFRSGQPLPNSAQKLGPRIDTRGEGGYIVAPPSIHPDGGTYQWDNRLPITNVPDWIVTALQPPARRDPPRLQPFYGATPYGRAALKRMRDDLIAAVEGSRNQTLNTVAFNAGRLAAGGQLDRSDCAQLVDVAVSTGLRVSEVDATFNSGFNAGLSAEPIAPAERQRPTLVPRPYRPRPPKAA